MEADEYKTLAVLLYEKNIVLLEDHVILPDGIKMC